VFRVYAGTGRSGAVSCPLWFYVLFVLPFQLLWWAIVAVLFVAAVAAVVLAGVGRWAWRSAPTRGGGAGLGRGQ